MTKAFKWLMTLALLAALIVAGGFVVFVELLSRKTPHQVVRADAIVAWTGGRGRIREAVELLADGKGRRLLISGVNRATTRRTLARTTPGFGSLFDCCIDIGYRALDTIGNATETRDWVTQNHFRRIILVTSNYHMPRSLTELHRALPDVEIVPFPVTAHSLRLERWWSDPTTRSVLLSEYMKLLPAAARLAYTRTIGGSAGEAGTRPAQLSLF